MANKNEQNKTFRLDRIKLCGGVGSLEDDSVCVMAGAAALHAVEQGTPLTEATDNLDCACPIIRALVIRRNDSFKDAEERTRWGLRLIPHIIGSRDESKLQERAFRCADVAVREILAELLETIGIKHALHDLEPIVDQDTAEAAEAAAEAAAKAELAWSAAEAAAEAAELAAELAAAAAAATAAKAAAAAKAAVKAAKEAKAATAATAASISMIALGEKVHNPWRHIDNLILELLGINEDTPLDEERLSTPIPVPNSKKLIKKF